MYGYLLDPDANVIDDFIIYRRRPDLYLLVVNAANRRKIVDWVDAHLPPGRAQAPGQEILCTDVTRLWAMFSIQGPRSVELLQPLADVDLHLMRYYNGAQVRILHPAARRQAGAHKVPE